MTILILTQMIIDHIDNTYTYPFTDVLCFFTNGLGVGNLNKKHVETLLTCRVLEKQVTCVKHIKVN